MVPVLYTGRPADCTGRLEKEIRTYDLLDELQIPYWRLDHDATATIDACHDVDVRLDIEICKNLFLCNAQKTDFYMLMMPGHKKFKTAKLSKQIEAPAFPLQARNSWRNFWISRRVLSACWG